MINYRETVDASRALRYEASVHFRRENNIRMGLLYFAMRPDLLRRRVSEFESVCQSLGTLVEMSVASLDPTLYKNVLKLRGMLGSIAPRTVVEAVNIYKEFREEEGYDEVNKIASAFDAMNQKITSGEWAFARQLTNPHKLASALIIESYGVFTEKLMNEPEENGLAKTVVLAVEEVLLLHYPDSEVLRDIKDKMKQEKADFGEGLASILENM